MTHSRISTVTICFNNLEELKATLRSVDRQKNPPFEHWIVDGSTHSEIEEYLNSTPQPDYRRWKCEPDQGIADAFNKGVRNAEGDIINFLNSGDEYFDGETLGKVAQEFEEKKELQWLHGAYVFHRGGIWLHAGTPFELSKLYKGMRQISHQSIFARKELFERHGGFDETIKVAMDYDWLVRVAEEESSYLAYPLCKFAPDGASYQNPWTGLREVSASYQKYRGVSAKPFLWSLRTYLLFQFTQKTSLGKWLFQLKNRGKTEGVGEPRQSGG